MEMWRRMLTSDGRWKVWVATQGQATVWARAHIQLLSMRKNAINSKGFAQVQDTEYEDTNVWYGVRGDIEMVVDHKTSRLLQTAAADSERGCSSPYKNQKK